MTLCFRSNFSTLRAKTLFYYYLFFKSPHLSTVFTVYLSGLCFDSFAHLSSDYYDEAGQ